MRTEDMSAMSEWFGAKRFVNSSRSGAGHTRIVGTEADHSKPCSEKGKKKIGGKKLSKEILKDDLPPTVVLEV